MADKVKPITIPQSNPIRIVQSITNVVKSTKSTFENIENLFTGKFVALKNPVKANEFKENSVEYCGAYVELPSDKYINSLNTETEMKLSTPTVTRNGSTPIGGDLRRVSLSNMLLQNTFPNFPTFNVSRSSANLSSANILPRNNPITPSMPQKSSTCSLLTNTRTEDTVGITTPYQQNKTRSRQIRDYFDFDEGKDEIDDSHSGTVYKCRRRNIPLSEEQNEDSMIRSSTTMGTAISSSSVGSNVSNCSFFEQEYAVKKIKKAKFHHLSYKKKQMQIRYFRQEIKALKRMQDLKKICHTKHDTKGSEYVIDFVDVFEDKHFLYIVTNYCSRGNLWSHIESVTSETDVRKIIQQILEGISFLHRNDVAHLNIAPDNIVFDEQNNAKIIGFGMSRIIPPLRKIGLFDGIMGNFIAPEVIEGVYDMKADVWSAGIILFMLRFGYPPFFDDTKSNIITRSQRKKMRHRENQPKLIEKIKSGFDSSILPGCGAWFPSEIRISQSLQDLISKMLEKDPTKRLTATQCLNHPYFEEAVDINQLPPTIMDTLTTFRGQCHFKAMISKLFSQNIKPSQMKELKKCWDKCDTNSTLLSFNKNDYLNKNQFKKAMKEYDNGYEDCQIEEMFRSLRWKPTDAVSFHSLLKAFEDQRSIAVDERLWQAFVDCDVDHEGYITKAEIKQKLIEINFDGFHKHKQNKVLSIASIFAKCTSYMSWDEGKIDYEEFLRALHSFNEDPITPNQSENVKFTFQPSWSELVKNDRETVKKGLETAFL